MLSLHNLTFLRCLCSRGKCMLLCAFFDLAAAERPGWPLLLQRLPHHQPARRHQCREGWGGCYDHLRENNFALYFTIKMAMVHTTYRKRTIRLKPTPHLAFQFSCLGSFSLHPAPKEMRKLLFGEQMESFHIFQWGTVIASPTGNFQKNTHPHVAQWFFPLLSLAVPYALSKSAIGAWRSLQSRFRVLVQGGRQSPAVCTVLLCFD